MTTKLHRGLWTDYAKLFDVERPLLDLRSPSEFAQAHFPHSTNIPLLSDAERHEVGLRYKLKGEQAAIALGHEIVSGTVREERIAQWSQWANNHPKGVLFCWRGGLRSQLVQQVLQERDIAVPKVAGGYKALRRFALDKLENTADWPSFIVVTGRTGVGKTELLKRLPSYIDLEGIAKHRGSVFGASRDVQPTQSSFENALAIDLHQRGQVRPCWLEDESKLIGRCALPLKLQAKMRFAPCVELVDTLDNRVMRLLGEYVISRSNEYQASYGETGISYFESDTLKQFDRIKKRLGGRLHAEVRQLIEQAFEGYRETGDARFHEEWINQLLTRYYDPMYDYQAKKRARPPLLQADSERLLKAYRAIESSVAP